MTWAGPDSVHATFITAPLLRLLKQMPGAVLRTEGPGPRLMAEGDLVIVYERFDSMKALTLTAKGTYNNKFGNFAMKAR